MKKAVKTVRKGETKKNQMAVGRTPYASDLLCTVRPKGDCSKKSGC